MSLCIALFEDDLVDQEIDGLEWGGCDDFEAFRARVADELLEGDWRRGFPVLLTVVDNSAGWPADHVADLAVELRAIAEAFDALPSELHDPESWQASVLAQLGREPSSLREFFIDVDGQPVIDRLLELAEQAATLDRPLSFT
ncbi:MAG: Imm70 family immunity protein [Phycisphaerales bacterium JB038]